MSLTARIQQRVQEQQQLQQESAKTIQREVAVYKGLAAADVASDPLKWWQSHKGALPELHNVALPCLAARAASTPAERLFSIAKHVHSLARYRLLPATLNKPVLAKANQNEVHV